MGKAARHTRASRSSARRSSTTRSRVVGRCSPPARRFRARAIAPRASRPAKKTKKKKLYIQDSSFVLLRLRTLWRDDARATLEPRLFKRVLFVSFCSDGGTLSCAFWRGLSLTGVLESRMFRNYRACSKLSRVSRSFFPVADLDDRSRSELPRTCARVG